MSNGEIIFELLYEFIESLEEGILVIKSEGTIVLANCAFEHIYGYCQSELVGKTFNFLCAESKSRQLGNQHFISLPDSKFNILIRCKNGAHRRVDVFKVETKQKIDNRKIIILRLKLAELEWKNDIRIHYENDNCISKNEDKNVNDIKKGLHSDNLRLVYQPIVDCNEKIVAIETLLRCVNNHGDLILPSEFLAIAQRYNLLESIEKWVINQSIKELKTITNTNFIIHINLSIWQLLRKDCISFIKETLIKHHFKAERVCIEIIYNQAQYHENITTSCQALQRLGLKISINSFGMQHISFPKLAELNADQFKIDRYYINNLTNEVNLIEVQSILKLATFLNTEVVVEGIEDKIDYQYLKKLGCNYFQGMYFYSPCDLDLLKTIFEKQDG